ncbi:hypothetical protein CLU79DRAFT_833887 [Phycomyces nitens]|nr:hypothetical protein CLU79DRAFT_833887 [Phycomyces nitens]
MWRKDHYLHHGTIINNPRSSPLPSDLLHPHQESKAPTTSLKGCFNTTQYIVPVVDKNLLLRNRPFNAQGWNYNPNNMYGGNEFDIFGSEQNQVDNFNHDVSRSQDRLIVCLEKDFAQEQVRYQLLKRKRSLSPNPSVGNNGIFLESTASANSPVNFFKPKPEQSHSQETQFMYL